MFFDKSEIIAKINSSLFGELNNFLEKEKSIKSELEGKLKISYNRT